MDTRLWTIAGMRPETLKSTDVPNVARAIVGYYRGFAQIHGGFECNVSYVLFQAIGFQCLIRCDDWAKILPFVQSGALSPPAISLLPWGSVVNFSNVDIYDSLYYRQVVGVLSGLFLQRYPTSYL